MQKIVFGLVGLIMVTLSGCANKVTSNPYVPTSADTTATATLLDLQEGRILYMANCGKCHGLYAPEDFNATKWQREIAQMAPNTTMSADQVALVLKYVSKGK